MTESPTLPAALASWTERTLGPLTAVHDTSHARENSLVWRVGTNAGNYYVKVAPEPLLHTREVLAYHEAVPLLGDGNAPSLKASSGELLAIILTAVDGQPLKAEALPERRRAAHQQAGQLLRRFHDALPVAMPQDQAVRSIKSIPDRLENDITQAGCHLSHTEAETLRRLVRQLNTRAPLPTGWLHGDFWERNLLWNGQHCALIDFERSEPGVIAADFTKLATSVWPDHPELRTALFEGYERALSKHEESALAVFVAADAASALAYGPRHGDPFVTARGRRTVERLMREERR